MSPFELCLLLTTIFSVLLQLYTIFLILKASSPSMFNYRYYLILFTSFDCLFTALIGMGLCPTVMFPWSMVLVNGFFSRFGQEGVYVGVCAIFFCGTMAVCCQDLCMMYRIVSLVKMEGVRKWFFGWSGRGFLLVVGVLISIGYALPVYKLQQQGQELIPQLPKLIAPSEEYHYLFLYNPNSTLSLAFDCGTREAWIYAGALLGGLSLSEVLCFSIGAAIFSILRKDRGSFSNKTYRMHLQLTLLLVIQLLTPIVCIVFPVATLCLVSVFYAIPVSRSAGEVGFFALTLYATTNSLLTILFVTPFRNYTKKLLMGKWRCGKGGGKVASAPAGVVLAGGAGTVPSPRMRARDNSSWSVTAITVGGGAGRGGWVRSSDDE